MTQKAELIELISAGFNEWDFYMFQSAFIGYDDDVLQAIADRLVYLLRDVSVDPQQFSEIICDRASQDYFSKIQKLGEQMNEQTKPVSFEEFKQEVISFTLDRLGKEEFGGFVFHQTNDIFIACVESKKTDGILWFLYQRTSGKWSTDSTNWLHYVGSCKDPNSKSLIDL